MIKKLIFDLDDTLIMWKDEYVNALKQTLKQHNINEDEDYINNLIDNYEEHFNKYNKETLLNYINENIKSHVTLDLRKNWNDGLIQSIVLGPKFSGNEYDFEFFVDQNFANEIIIQQSKIPYRG